MTEITAAARYDRTPVRWGQGHEMTALEAAMWRTDDHAMLRSASVVVELLDVTPDWDRFRAGHAMGIGRVPRLRQRVVEDPLRIGPPAWVDTRVELDHHVRRVQLGEGATFEDVLAVAATMQLAPFGSEERPLWEAALVEGLPGGQSAYVLKLHHAMADSQAVVALFDLIHSRVREPTSGRPTLPDALHDQQTPLGLAADHALHAVHQTPAAAARALNATGRLGREAIRHPRRTLTTAAHLTKAFGATFGAGNGRPSPLLRGRDVHRALDAVDLPTATLRAAAEAAGGTLGDAVLAAVVDGLARYHTALGTPVAALPIAVPLTLRPAGLEDNRFARARILAPTTDLPIAERMAALRALVAEAHAQPQVDLLRFAAAIVSRAPAGVVNRWAERATRPLALQAFTVRGLDREAYLAGARVLRMFSFGPTNGCAVAATLTTHEDTCCLGLTYDTAAVTDVPLMARSLRDAFDELLAVDAQAEAAA